MTTTQHRPGGEPDFSRLRLGQVPIVLMYHMIADVPEDPHKLAVAPARFEEQMAWLAGRGLRGVSMETLMAAMRAGRARGLVGLTFDDGYLSVLEDALPVLQRHDFAATMFIISDRIGGTNEWDAGTGPVWPLMTAEQVAQVAAAGMEIGSHTATHPRLPGIAGDHLTTEISGSRARLRELFDLPVTGFAYPYGRMDAAARQAVRDAGYGYACSVETPVSLLGDMTLPRITFYDRDGAGRMAAKKLFFRSYTAALGTRRGLSYSPLAQQVKRTLAAPLHRLRRLRRHFGGALQQERPEAPAYHVDVEVALEPRPRRVRRGRQRRRRVEQLEERRRGAGRVVERPEAGFGTVFAEFGDGADAASDDGQPRGHRLDDRERGGFRV
jgi:peptidoglycan/xylan/chitin deacetylase (PgdA/CDA1 family)